MRLALIAGAGLVVAASHVWAASEAAKGPMTIPEPLRVEHHELFEELEKATKAGGKTGAAAAKVRDVLRPHFEKEERYALPQLGALDSVTGGGTPRAELTADLIRRSDAFRAELPKMLEEHKRIGAALHEMERAAESEKKAGPARLAEKILGHAMMEEKVLYPASLLLGEYAKATEKAK